MDNKERTHYARLLLTASCDVFPDDAVVITRDSYFLYIDVWRKAGEIRYHVSRAYTYDTLRSLQTQLSGFLFDEVNRMKEELDGKSQEPPFEDIQGANQ